MDAVTDLLLRARDGDHDALASWIATTQPEVWRLCAHLVDPDAADDVTQDTYVRAMRALPRFRGDASSRTWLLSIARRAAADAIRARTRRRRHLDEAAVPVRSHGDPTGEVDIAELVAALPADQREAFVLTQVLGLTYEETAEVCRCPVGTIRSRVARARGRLVDAIGQGENATGS